MHETVPQRAATGIDLVCAGVGASLLLWLAQALVAELVPGPHGRADTAFTLLYFAVALGMAVGLFLVAGVSRRPGVLTAAAATIGVLELAELATALVFKTGTLLGAVPVPALLLLTNGTMVLALGARALTLLGLAQVAAARRPWVVPVAWLSGALQLLRTLVVLLRSLHLLDSDLGRSKAWMHVTMGAGMVGLAALFAVAWGARSAVREGLPAAQVRAGVDAEHLAPSSAVSGGYAGDLLAGAVFLFAGAMLGAVSLSATGGSGRYLVPVGALAVGLARLGRGLVRFLRRS